MAVSNYGPYDVQTFQADVDMAGNVGRFGVITATGVALAGDGARAHGVIVGVEKAGIGADIGLMTTPGRKVPVAVNSAVVRGSNLCSDANGKADNGGAGNVINAITLEAAAADDDLVTALFGNQGTV